MLTGIYKIICKINSKFYVGSSVNLAHRWITHRSALRNHKHCNYHLQFAWNKYGEENFEFQIIEECEENKLIEKEQYYLDLYKCYNREIGYNICEKANNGKSSIFDSSKTYLIIKPDGQKIIVSNLEKFCRENNITENGLRNVANGHSRQYKGWHCRHINDSNKDWLKKQKRKEKSGPYDGKWKIIFRDNTFKIVKSLYAFAKEFGYSLGYLENRKNNKIKYKKQTNLDKKEITKVEKYNE